MSNTKPINPLDKLESITTLSLSERVREANARQKDLFFYIVQSKIETTINEQGMEIPDISVDVRSCKSGQTPVLAEGERIIFPI